MIKVVGSICILLGGGLTWYLQMAERRRERDTLADLIDTLRRIGDEIRITRTPLPVLLENAGKTESNAGIFFRIAAEEMKRGNCSAEMWKRAAGVLPLPESDCGTLKRLGESLYGDEETACRAVALAVMELTKRAETLEQRRQTEEKRITAICFSAAALLVILLV